MSHFLHSLKDNDYLGNTRCRTETDLLGHWVQFPDIVEPDKFRKVGTSKDHLVHPPAVRKDHLPRESLHVFV